MTLIEEVIQTIKRRPFYLRYKVMRWEGICYWNQGIIYIHPHTRNKTSVLIHEVLHWVRPKWSEKMVLYHERRLYQRLTDDHWTFFQRVIRDMYLKRRGG